MWRMHCQYVMPLIERLNAGTEHFTHISAGVQRNREETGDQRAVVASEVARELTAHEEPVHRVHKHREDREVHQENLNEERCAAEEAHPDRHGPPDTEVQQCLERLMAGLRHAGHAENHAKEHAADNACERELDRHLRAFNKERPIVGKDVETEHLKSVSAGTGGNQ